MTEPAIKPPTISVLMPVYNAEEFLEEALDSVLRQSFGDFEVIAVNDGSADLSGKILDRYADSDKRIRVFHRSNNGLAATLNYGIALAKGKWIARMDADDIALPNRFMVQLDHLSRVGADFCGGGVEYFGDRRAVGRYPASHDCCGVQLLFNVPFAHPTVIGRTAAFKSLRYDEKFVHAQDFDLWQRAWVSGYRLTNVVDPVLRYRSHKRQISSMRNAEQRRMADQIRLRHWRYVYPDLDHRWTAELVSAFNQGVDDAKPLLVGMLKVRSHIPQGTHKLYLKGCLGILVRITTPRLGVVSEWIKFYNLMRVRDPLTKIRGVLVLFLYKSLRVNPHAFGVACLRGVKNKFILMLK